jgi:hypothetical protein
VDKAIHYGCSAKTEGRRPLENYGKTRVKESRSRSQETS